MEELLKKLTDIFFISGNESATKQFSKELAKHCETITDRNGNIIGTMGNMKSRNHIMLEAHMDQIGLVVTNVLEHGFLKVTSCGGMNVKVLPGSRVKIYGTECITGIVCSTPPHLAQGKEDKYPKVEELYIDTGLSTEEAQEKIPLFSYVGFATSSQNLLNNRTAAPALDNRASIASLLHCAKILSKTKLDCKVSFVLSVGEETTGAGAKTASFEFFPQEAIVVDVSFAKQPGIPSENKGELGVGPMIGFSPALSNELSHRLVKLANKNEIPYQYEIMGGKTGTNADNISITKSGIKTGLLSIPIRNMHSPVEVVDLNDIKNTAKLLASYVKRFPTFNN